MTSNSISSHTKIDNNTAMEDNTSEQIEDTLNSLSVEEENISSHPTTEEVHLELPEPDADNIAVLTDKLPNKPILPWNRYDSPWEASEENSAEVQESDSSMTSEVTENHLEEE